MNLMGEPLRVGQQIHSAERPVTPEIIAFYQDTFGDRNPMYAPGAQSFGGPVAPPLLYHSEVYAHPERWYLKNLIGNLHAQQDWELFAPIRPGMKLRTRSTLIDRFPKRGREYLVNEVDYQDEEGRLLVRGRTFQSFLADTPQPDQGFVADRETSAKKERRPVGEGEGPEVEPVELAIDATTCWRFSGPGRNYHTDVEQARKLGFPEIVVQGMMSTCLISQLMAQTFGEGWIAGGRMSVKLVNVLWAGEAVRARGKLRSERAEGTTRRRTLEVWVEKQDESRTPVTVGEASALV